MSHYGDLLLLICLAALVGAWLKLTRAREVAVVHARRECERHGLQLLDETVGLRALRLRRHAGRLRLERSYAFEVSIDGHDREPGQLQMADTGLVGLRLPTVTLQMADQADAEADAFDEPAADVAKLPASGNVVRLDAARRARRLN